MQRRSMTREELALVEFMRQFKLEAGQMLLLGPSAVAMAFGRRSKGPLDKHIFEKSEWCADSSDGGP